MSGRKVNLRVIEIPTTTMDVKSGKSETSKILYGAYQTIAPVKDGFGRLQTGIKGEDAFNKIMAKEGGNTDVSYKDYYAKTHLKVSSDGRVLDLEIPNHELIYNWIKHVPDVCMDFKKLNPAVHTFVLYDEEAEAEKAISSIEMKMKAYSYLNEMSSEDVIDFLVLYGTKSTKSISSKLAKSRLAQNIETNPSKFVELFEYNNKSIKINLKKLINIGICRKEGQAIFYGDEGDALMIGINDEMAIEFLKDTQNQELYVSLLKLLNDVI